MFCIPYAFYVSFGKGSYVNLNITNFFAALVCNLDIIFRWNVTQNGMSLKVKCYS